LRSARRAESKDLLLPSQRQISVLSVTSVVKLLAIACWLLARLEAMLLYAITNRHLLQPDDPGAPSLANANRGPHGQVFVRGVEQRSTRVGTALISLTRLWATRNIEYIQIREKDLAPDDLQELTQAIVSAAREINQTTKILLNGPADIAFAAGADGVHFPANAPSNAARDARALFAQSGREAILSHSCHSVQEVLRIREESQRDPHATTANTLILDAPIFEKVTPDGKLPGQGLDGLRAAVHAAGNIPVLALGGITPENAPACVVAGAAGIAAIRLFLEEEWKHLRKNA